MTEAVVAVDNMAVASNAAKEVEVGVVVVDVAGSGRPTVCAVGGGDGKDWKGGRRGRAWRWRESKEQRVRQVGIGLDVAPGTDTTSRPTAHVFISCPNKPTVRRAFTCRLSVCRHGRQSHQTICWN